MHIRTQLKAGKLATNHNDALAVRSAVKAGGISVNHNEALSIRTSVKAGTLRRLIRTTSAKNDRLELLIVRAGLRAGGRKR